MSGVFALNWRSFVLVVCIAALPRTDALRKCRFCVGTFFNNNWDHFAFNGTKPPFTPDCHLAKTADTLPLAEQRDCPSDVCIDYFIWNSLSVPEDPALYSHVRDCAENLLGKQIPKSVGPNYCDFGAQEWCTGDVTKAPFNIVCGTALVTYSSLCTTRTEKEPPCNNDYNYYKFCLPDPKTNQCFVCDRSANAAECKNERFVYGKWCTKTTLRDSNGATIWVERGASATNAYSNDGSQTHTTSEGTFTIDYCSTTNCNGIYPWTATSTTTAAPASSASSGPTKPSTAPPPPPSPSSESSTAPPPPPATTTKLASSIVASSLTVGVCAMLLTMFGR